MKKYERICQIIIRARRNDMQGNDANDEEFLTTLKDSKNKRKKRDNIN